jgi:hypothetical protein
VHALEARIRKLEDEIQIYQSAPQSFHMDTGQQPAEELVSNHYQSERSPDSYTSNGQSNGVDPRSNVEKAEKSLESAQKLLSLEATAERYLGSSSGVSFARLTQAILKRLKPDLQPFIFSDALGNFAARANVANVVGSLGNPSPPTSRDQLSSVIGTNIDLPNEEHAYQMVEYYWSHSHTLYPFIQKAAFMKSLKVMYANPNEAVLQSSHSWLYTMWMVFATSSTSLSSVMNSEETKSIRYWNAAMTHFNETLEEGDMEALNAILLQVSYSFFNQVGLNTWYLVGIGIRLALGMGLHTTPTKATIPIPKNVQEYRSRIFFSLYMMDRLVSITLGRPLGIRDDDIDIEPFAAADDNDILSDKILPHQQLTLAAAALPLHILSLRKLAGEIFLRVYSNRNRDLPLPERDSIIRGLHEKLIEWRRNMPFPLPESRTQRVPHLCTTWFDLNYHNHVIMLYRPSPLCPSITFEKVTILADASATSLRHVATMQRQQRFAFNWLNLFAVFTSTLALIYTVTAQPESICLYLQQSDALEDLRIAVDILDTFGSKFPLASKYRDMVRDIISSLESHLPSTSFLESSETNPPLPSSDARSSLISVDEQTRSGRTPHDSATFNLSLPAENISYDFSNETDYRNTITDQPDTDINLSSTRESLSLAIQLFQAPGLFDEFAGQDFASGLDMTGQMGLDEQLLSCCDSGFWRAQREGSESGGQM